MTKAIELAREAGVHVQEAAAYGTKGTTMTTLHEASLKALELCERIRDEREVWGTDELRKVCIALRSALAQQGESMAGFDRGYAARLIEALYDNGDPVSVDAAEEFERLLAAPAPQAQPDQRFINLLCRIHRDGGHYIAEHGLDRAAADADTKVAHLNVMNDAQAPQAQEPLTDEQIKDLARGRSSHVEFARAIERAHGIVD